LKIYQHNKKQQASNKQATMASRKSPYMYSPSCGTMPNTYRKLSSSWDTKTGKRDHLANVFCNTVKSDAVLHVPAIMMTLLNDIHANSDMLKELQCVNPGAVKMGDDARTLWIYSMRPSDAMPKNAEELERLYAFVRAFTKKHLDGPSNDYLDQHIHIAVCFFVWFFTKHNFYFYTKEIRQTTRGGIQKQWRSVLLTRVPVMVITQSPSIPKVRGDIHQKTILVKLEEEQANLKADIEKLLSSVCVVDFEDEVRLRETMSMCMTMGSKCYITGKKSKKLQKSYQDYVKVTDKVNKTRKSLFQIESVEKKSSLTIMVPADDMWGVAGEPPSPPKLIRQNAEDGFCFTGVQETEAYDMLPESLEVEEDDVPDSWEDL
jgi:hypothetical protein